MTQRTVPLDPDSPRGRELAREMTILLDDIADEIAEERRLAALRAEHNERRRQAR